MLTSRHVRPSFADRIVHSAHHEDPMLDRRRVVQGGLAAVGSLSLAAPRRALAQSRPPVKVRYSEVIRSILYAPAYVAIAKGYFKEAGLDVSLTTAQGGDKAMAGLLGNNADISLMGPEAAIYVMNSESPVKVRIFCGLTATDGFLLMSRAKLDGRDWSQLKGKEILGFRPGSTPQLFLEAALRRSGIDPLKDVKIATNVAIPARMGAWLAGQNQFGIFVEPDAAQLELDGKAHFFASGGEIIGPADYTAFMATDKFIKDNPETLQAWTNAIHRAMQWTATAPAAEVVAALEPYFPGVNPQALLAATDRYRKLKIWKTTPMIDPGPIETFQDVLVQGNVLEAAKKVKYESLIVTDFASKAK
jgi:NitT/TauT family transport system substrate-binding protein